MMKTMNVLLPELPMRPIRSFFVSAACLAGAALCGTAGATDVGVSDSISQPGVYGRIDIGRFPQPQIIVAQPVVIRPAPSYVQPVYMWVPPGHRKDWSKHCGSYNACGVPVYFVQDEWYEQTVMTGGKGKGGNGKGNGNGNGKGNGHGNGNGKG